MEIFDRRLERFKTVISNRQNDLAVVLENVHDPHNIGAILRTCDSVGLRHIYIISTEKRLQDRNKYKKLASASGASKWLSLYFFDTVQAAAEEIKNKFGRLLTTHLTEKSESIYDLEYVQSCAIAFGNEHDGISPELLSYSDGNILIPQFGMVQSLNISVACAISLYEICRQRIVSGVYDKDFDASNPDQAKLFESFKEIHKADKIKNRKP